MFFLYNEFLYVCNYYSILFNLLYVPSKGHTDKSPGFGAEGIKCCLRSWHSTCIGCAEIDKNKSLSESWSDKMTQFKISVKVIWIYLVMLLVGDIGGTDLDVLVSSLNVNRFICMLYRACYIQLYRIICITKWNQISNAFFRNSPLTEQWCP